jgi:hypothetical protein
MEAHDVPDGLPTKPIPSLNDYLGSKGKHGLCWHTRGGDLKEVASLNKAFTGGPYHAVKTRSTTKALDLDWFLVLFTAVISLSGRVFQRFVHREDLSNFEPELTICNSGPARITESLDDSNTLETPTFFVVLTPTGEPEHKSGSTPISDRTLTGATPRARQLFLHNLST